MAHCRGASCMGDCVCGCSICCPDEPKKMRKQISEKAVDQALAILKDAIIRRLNQKGWGTFSSTHEVSGIVTEEYHEFLDEVQANNMKKIMKELEDIAVACVFAKACQLENGLEW